VTASELREATENRPGWPTAGRVGLVSVTGLAALAGLALRGGRPLRAAGWLLVTLPAGAVAELLLDLIYRQQA
jgi:hypothetical protein